MPWLKRHHPRYQTVFLARTGEEDPIDPGRFFRRSALGSEASERVIARYLAVSHRFLLFFLSMMMMMMMDASRYDLACRLVPALFLRAMQLEP